jgi:GGDEF domain-containing protein
LAGRVRENLADLNAKKELPFAVSLSIGWATHEGGARISAEEFLKRIDDRMYAAKADRCAAGRVEQ